MFKNQNKNISVTRESVCMGDDCTAPNENVIKVFKHDMISTVLLKVAQSLPQMNHVIWAIDTGKKVLGYILMEDALHYQFELCVEEQAFLNMEIYQLHCSYFHSNSFHYRENENKHMEQNKQSKTLLEKVKCQMAKRFIDEIKIKGGGIQIWGEWFGRPHDNFHVIKSAQWKLDEIILHFEEGESLYVQNPSVITNDEKSFIVDTASKILWVWYSYGKEHTYEHLYVREYIKNIDGVILRVEGKRKDITKQPDIIFQPQRKIALIIE